MFTTTAQLVTYVEYLYPGAIVSEGTTEATPDRDPARVARIAPAKAFCFRFFDRAVATADVDGQEVELRSRPLRQSGRFYIDAVKLSYADVEAMGGDHKILLDNMRYNHWDYVLRCRTGNFQPPNSGDSVVSTAGRWP